jgi:SAM-dependent methyltransferase
LEARQEVPMPTGKIDYDAIYRGASKFEELIENRPPWDIGEPQPDIVALVAAGDITGDVLDAGCGLGENAVLFAEHGCRVTAFDSAQTAIRRAAELAAVRGVEVDFRLADATALPDFGRRFDTIVDSALFHCLGPVRRRDYVDALRDKAKHGGLLHVLCFSDTRSPVSPAAHRIGEAELRDVLANGWDVVGLRPATICTSLTRTAIERIATAAGRAVDELLESFTVDGQGRYRNAAWLATARRN